MYENMAGWTALVYVALSAWIFSGSNDLEPRERLAWTLFWPIFGPLFALVVVLRIAVVLATRWTRR